MVGKGLTGKQIYPEDSETNRGFILSTEHVCSGRVYTISGDITIVGNDVSHQLSLLVLIDAVETNHQVCKDVRKWVAVGRKEGGRREGKEGGGREGITRDFRGMAKPREVVSERKAWLGVNG